MESSINVVRRHFSPQDNKYWSVSLIFMCLSECIILKLLTAHSVLKNYNLGALMISAAC